MRDSKANDGYFRLMVVIFFVVIFKAVFLGEGVGGVN